MLLAFHLDSLAFTSCPCFDYFTIVVDFPALLLLGPEIEDLDVVAH
jgi:hypothetical protein